MSEAKATTVVLKADLQCYRCYSKIKGLLCRYKEIRDQVFDDKNDTVTIVVFCCTPERIVSKLKSKAGKTIKSIQILKPKSEPDKPKPADPKPDKPSEQKPPPAKVPEPVPKPKEPAPKPKEPAPKPKEAAPKPVEPPPKPKEPAPKPVEPAPKPLEPAMKPSEPASKPIPIQMANPVQGYPSQAYQCFEGYQAGPGYYYGYGPPAIPQQQPYYVNYGTPPPPPPPPYRNECYFSEENPSGCAVM